MISYASSKSRVVLFGAMLAGCYLVLSPSGWGQTTAPAGAAAETVRGGGFLSIIPNDPITYIIATLSFVAVTLIIQAFIKARATVYMPAGSVNAIAEMISQRQGRELLEFVERDPSFVSRALAPALRRAPSFNAMKEALETSVAEQTANEFRKIEYLNIIGNLGPLLGLLGTVLGMIQAFSAMQAAGGQANPSQLAGGISTALAHTFLGLALAIPCLAAFGILRTITDKLTVEASLKAEELLLLAKPPETAVARPAPVGAAPSVGIPGGMVNPSVPPPVLRAPPPSGT